MVEDNGRVNRMVVRESSGNCEEEPTKEKKGIHQEESSPGGKEDPCLEGSLSEGMGGYPWTV